MSRRLWTMLAVVTALVLGYAVPAHAATTWQYTDDMGKPPYMYFFDYPSQAHIMSGPVEAGLPPHSQPTSAYVSAGNGTGFGSVYQYVQIAPVTTGHRPECRFSAWTFNDSGQDFNIEVIDPTTWSWVSVARRSTFSNYTWEQKYTPWFYPTISQVVLRVSLLAPGSNSTFVTGYVDDFDLTCTY